MGKTDQILTAECSGSVRRAPEIPAHSWVNKTMVSFDLETTGVEPETDRIVTAAVTVVGKDQETVNYSWTANPGVNIPEGASAVHGISNEEAAKAPPISEVLPEIISALEKHLGEDASLVIFNADYDLTMLDREAKRNGLQPLTDRIDVNVLDPLVMDKHANRYRKGSRSLGALCEIYNVPLENAHNANDDALAAARLAWRLGNANPDLAQMTAEEIHENQVEWAKAQRESLKAHFKREGKDRDVRTEWPMTTDKEPALA